MVARLTKISLDLENWSQTESGTIRFFFYKYRDNSYES